MTDKQDPIIPFRWNITKREQLGHLIGGELAEIPDGYYEELREVCAKVVAQSEDSNLVFVGRSPEHVFDYLSGSFAALDDERLLTLLQFSSTYKGPHWNRRTGPRDFNAKEKSLFLKYLSAEQIDPNSLTTAKRPIRFVDLVSTGSTYLALLELYKDIARAQGADWNVVSKRIGFTGLTIRTKNTPNAYRWQLSSFWREAAGPVSANNVSVSWQFWNHAGNLADKVTPSHHRHRWASANAAKPLYTESALKALNRSINIYDHAASPQERRLLAKRLTELFEFREPWLRKLTLELKNNAQK